MRNSLIYFVQGLRYSVPKDNPGNIHPHNKTGKNLFGKKREGFPVRETESDVSGSHTYNFAQKDQN